MRSKLYFTSFKQIALYVIFYNNLPNLAKDDNEINFKTIPYDSQFHFLSVYGMINVNSGILFDYNAIIKA